MDHILICFHVNVETKKIRLPDANIAGAYLALRKQCFNHGKTIGLPNATQELRGLFTHYSNCNTI